MNDNHIEILCEPADLRARLAQWRAQGQRLVLVPTMGALHAGHMSLVKEAKRLGDRVLVSVFVNPTQFAPNEDFGVYPRRLEADAELATQAGADLIFAPTPQAMYPQGFATTISLTGPATVGLEDKFRPTHFAGVATVVAKLFNLARPDVAIFGQKDYQQLQVIRQMTSDLDMDIGIVGAPTIREKDGLALSSRNLYLTVAERDCAPRLYAALLQCAREIGTGAASIGAALEATTKNLTEMGFAVDYLEARHAETLEPVASPEEGPIRLLVAAKLGTTRLIDNIAV